MMSSAKVHAYMIDGLLLRVADYPESFAADVVAGELQDDCYGLKRIDFKAGDVVIDIGAHIGLFASYIGLRFPDILIHAFEPFPDNFELLRQNLALNHVKNVRAHNLALSADGRFLEMAISPNNSGSATCQARMLTIRRTDMIPSTTLDEVFDALKLDHCKLLKIDCEGSEYEILLSTRVLAQVEYLSGEFHLNDSLASKGYTIEGLRRHCEKYIDPHKLVVESKRIDD
jgi:FkbM family methyltransferase